MKYWWQKDHEQESTAAGLLPLGHYTLMKSSRHQEKRGSTWTPSAVCDCCESTRDKRQAQNVWELMSVQVSKQAVCESVWKIQSASWDVNMHVTSHLPNNIKILDASEPQNTQWHNAIQLSHFHVWHHVSIGSGLAHWVLVVPSCSLCLW